MIRAKLTVAVQNHEVARSMMKAVEPDNQLAHLNIVGNVECRSLTFGLEFDGRVETFISTLDDMLRCLQAGMETLDAIKKGKPE